MVKSNSKWLHKILSFTIPTQLLSLKKETNKWTTKQKKTPHPNYDICYLCGNIFCYTSLEHLLCSFLCILIKLKKKLKDRIHISICCGIVLDDRMYVSQWGVYIYFYKEMVVYSWCEMAGLPESQRISFYDWQIYKALV